MAKTVLVIGTLDTKGTECGYVRDLIAARGIGTLVGRFFIIIPMLAVAGSLGRKKRVPPSPGTFPVTTPLFSALLVSVILIVGALTFFPALSLGPIVEHLLMLHGQVF